ncbi:lysophospholipase L1-like esterase [Microvirga flocculans]|uniref:Lysophospholipase L1-like esterase n=1 Tax=Microvirga flocculans TaxID=217168 RepID=A0A7W6IJ27_9HYPH|nr:GDSL-type esterase/lipase family protein [Microvirga flocculans]MBB4041996.1 lysophospholipase L1-like esterase [Microvirga flocculans]
MYRLGYGYRAARRRAQGGGASAALTLPAGASVIYSVRKVGTYGGPCLRAVRSSDNATLDIGFGTNGFIDVAAAETFRAAGGASAKLFVDIWYDQSGNGNHATQTTAASRPTFIPTNAWEGLASITFDSGPGGSGPSKHLNLPAGVVLDRQNGTVLAIDAPNSTWNSNALYEIGTVAGSRAAVYTNPNSTLNFLSGADGAVQTPKTIQARPNILIHRFSATAFQVYYKGASSSFAARGAGVYSGGRLGGSGAGLNFNYRGEKYVFAVWPGTLADQDVTVLRTALATAFPQAAPKTFSHCLVFDGNSITEGYGATDLQNNMRQTLRALGSTADIDVYNQAVFGTTSDVIYDARAAKHSGIDRVAAPGKNILVFGVGSNDINAGTSAANTWHNTVTGKGILPYIQYCQGLGYTVIVGTVLPRSSIASLPAREAERLALNDLIRNNAATYGYLVADYDTVADLANPASATYYLDTIHPTSLGYTRMAAVLAPVVQSVLAA